MTHRLRSDGLGSRAGSDGGGGIPPPGHQLMDAVQYFYRDGNVVGQAPAGTLLFDSDPGHEHWHFQQFARYALLSRRPHRRRCAARGRVLPRTHRRHRPDRAERGLQPRSLGFFGACGGATSIWTRERCRSVGRHVLQGPARASRSTSPTCATAPTTSRVQANPLGRSARGLDQQRHPPAPGRSGRDARAPDDPGAGLEGDRRIDGFDCTGGAGVWPAPPDRLSR